MSCLSSLSVPKQKAICASFLISPACTPTVAHIFISLREFLSTYDNEIANVPIIYGENRIGDIPHSLASIEKASKLLNYQPKFSMREGLKEAVKWYWNNLKK